MAHSFKKPVSNTNWIRSPICCVNHCAMGKWKKRTKRWQRRRNKTCISSFIKTNDECFLNKMIEQLHKTGVGNPWNGPHDGYYYNHFYYYYGYMK